MNYVARICRYFDAPIRKGNIRWITSKGAHIPISKATGEPVNSILELRTPIEERSFHFNKKLYNEVRGPEFKNKKGTAAVKLLLKEKKGFVKRAFRNPRIGSVDLLWGNERAGLCHILKSREEKDGEDATALLIDYLEDTITHGGVWYNKKRNSYLIWKDHGEGLPKTLAVVAKKYLGGNAAIVLTSYRKSKQPKGTPMGGTRGPQGACD